MRVPFILVATVVVGGIVLGLVRHSEMRELREHNEMLRGTLADLEQLREENDRLAESTVDLDELGRLRSEQMELLRLRAEVTELRRTANTTAPGLEEQIRHTLDEAEAAMKQAERIRAYDEAGERQGETRDMLRQLFGMLHETARYADGVLPGSFQQLELMISQAPEQSMIWMHGPEMLNHTNRFGLSARDFEFLPQTRPVTVQDESVLLLREREPRPHPDGGWLRAYGFSDGRTEEAFSEDGSFEEWERDAWAR